MGTPFAGKRRVGAALHAPARLVRVGAMATDLPRPS